MLVVHAVLAVAVVAIAAAGAVWGFVAYRRPRAGGRWLDQVLALAQTLLIAQVAVGLYLLTQGRRVQPRREHGREREGAVGVVEVLRRAPPEPRRRLLWFAVATLLATALAVRAYTTGGQ